MELRELALVGHDIDRRIVRRPEVRFCTDYGIKRADSLECSLHACSKCSDIGHTKPFRECYVQGPLVTRTFEAVANLLRLHQVHKYVIVGFHCRHNDSDQLRGYDSQASERQDDTGSPEDLAIAWFFVRLGHSLFLYPLAVGAGRGVHGDQVILLDEGRNLNGDTGFQLSIFHDIARRVTFYDIFGIRDT